MLPPDPPPARHRRAAPDPDDEPPTDPALPAVPHRPAPTGQDHPPTTDRYHPPPSDPREPAVTGGHPTSGPRPERTGPQPPVTGRPSEGTGSRPSATAARPTDADDAGDARSGATAHRSRADTRRAARRAAAGPDPAADHAGHGHGHGPPPRADRRVHRLLAVLLTPFVLLTITGLVLLFPTTSPDVDSTSGPRVNGHVSAAVERPCSDDPTDAAPDAIGCLALTVEVQEGPLAGQTIETLITAPRGQAPFGAGADVVLTTGGGDPTDPESYLIVDLQRDLPLLGLALIFVVAVLALGHRRGLAALAGLGLTGVVLIGFVLPAILAGRNPLLVAVVGCCAIMFGALYLTHGFSARTSTAVLGTLASLLLIALLGITFSGLAQLTGADEDTASLAATLGSEIDGRGLVLAGLVIGALGALDDVTVTQTTAVWELRAANPSTPPAALFRAAMRIGRDHLASAVNTLVLAYAGTALPLLLLFSVAERGLLDTLTTQVIATEVVRTLVGSIGLVVSVPLTTALAVAVASRGNLRAAPAAQLL